MWQGFKRTAEISAVAFLAVSCAVVVRAFCHFRLEETIPYTPFYPAIVVSTMYGRTQGGVISICLSAFAACFWIPPFGRLLIQEPSDLIGMGLFIIVGAILVQLCEAMRRAKQTAEEATRDERAAREQEQAARLEAEEANRLKDEFLALVSHELRTPLQAILGWAQLLRENDFDEPDRLEGLGTIARNAELQSRLVEDLIDVSRIAAGKLRIEPRPVNPQQIVESAIQSVATAAQAKGIAIERCYQQSELAIWADPDRLQQIVWNLLSNAIKFSSPQSTVLVTLRRARRGVIIEVEDQGEGISSEFLPHIFQPFRQADGSSHRKIGGLGLGLSIVKQLVELHGGTIEAASAGPGLGTRMTIALPMAESRAETPLAGSDSSPHRELRGVRVLVVEDDMPTCHLIARLLREHHSEVVTATSVDAALEALEGFSPDVIVSDIAMPDRDGYELLRVVRRREWTDNRVASAVALTAHASPDDKRRAYEAGYQIHLTKPVDSAALVGAVAELTVH